MATEPLKYGLPLRPPTASTALWARILKQDTQPSTSLSDMPIIVPPTIPLDKNATSMRVLLHDTQVNFEKFAVHVGKLIDGVNEAKHEIKTTNDLFERDRQTLMGDIIDVGMFVSLHTDTQKGKSFGEVRIYVASSFSEITVNVLLLFFCSKQKPKRNSEIRWITLSKHLYGNLL